MKRAVIAAGALALVLGLLVLAFVAGDRVAEQVADPATVATPAITPPPPEAHPSFLYGRITAVDGTIYEGRLRWGGGEEAFWSDYFNGRKDENPWAAHVEPERLEVSRPLTILGVTLADRKRQPDLDRPFMVRFGDITRIEPDGADILVTLKSGTVFNLDRLSADDLADGLRVWDGTHGTVDLVERQIRAIELLPAPTPGAALDRLHGTVRTEHGNFTGFIQWNREEGVGTDTLDGETVEGPLSLRFDSMRSIARDSPDSSRVTLLDGGELVLSGTREAGDGNLGIYVDDPRYGRVLIPWHTFERVDFGPGGVGPAYDDYPAGRPLTGSVTTYEGRSLVGRLVYDLDESEITETLDAPSEGVHYTIPFGLIDSIVLSGHGERAGVILQSGEELKLERAGDLGDGNGGMLIFADGGERPEYVRWADVERIDFDRPPAMYPPPGTPSWESGTARSADGVPISYQTAGKGSVSLVFVHGWTCDRSYWRGQLEFFARNHRVVALDLAGHGDSGLDRDAWTIPAFGRDVVAVMDSLDLKRVVLIGHSMGGPVIVEAARIAPQNVIGLVGVDTLQDPDAPRMTEEAIQRSVERFEKSFESAMRELVSGVMFAPDSEPELKSWIVADMASATPAVGIGALRNTLLWHSTGRSEALAALPAPMRLVNSTLFPTNSAAVERYGMDVAIMADVGHFLMLEAPETFNSLLASAIEDFAVRADEP